MDFELHLGDCLQALRQMPDDSVDSIVTDPPYGLTNKGGPHNKVPNAYSRAQAGAGSGGFMGMKWDADAPPVEVWAECLRVLKPGGYLLAFAGTRTQHRMAVRIEDAGFEIRDMIAWVYGSGFPKSHNGPWGGTALKPALEPITVARKPLAGTVEENWRKHGTGALDIDGCRVDGGARPLRESDRRLEHNTYGPGLGGSRAAGETVLGRWPANLIHDGSDEVLAAFPQAKGQQGAVTGNEPSSKTNNVYGQFDGRPATQPRGDTGSAARFFYCAKASKADRNEGLEDFTPATTSDGRAKAADNAYPRGKTERANTHPTVKPTDLMRYLCRLVTPFGGLVLDPFMGSGSTGKAAVLEGFRFIGCELSPEYMAIARARIVGALMEGLV